MNSLHRNTSTFTNQYMCNFRVCLFFYAYVKFELTFETSFLLQGFRHIVYDCVFVGTCVCVLLKAFYNSFAMLSCVYVYSIKKKTNPRQVSNVVVQLIWADNKILKRQSFTQRSSTTFKSFKYTGKIGVAI